MVWKVKSEGVWGSAEGSGVVEKSVDDNDSLKEGSMMCEIDCKIVDRNQASGWRVRVDGWCGLEACGCLEGARGHGSQENTTVGDGGLGVYKLFSAARRYGVLLS
jgi:hypothetical protein